MSNTDEQLGAVVPCQLELTLLGSGMVCPGCGFHAYKHPNHTSNRLEPYSDCPARHPDTDTAPTQLAIALDSVAIERARQAQLKADGKFDYTCADAELDNPNKLAILVEEVGEVARAVLEADSVVYDVHADLHLREELVQVAAVAVAWVECIDKELKDKEETTL